MSRRPPTSEDLLDRLLGDVSVDAGWKLIERFSTLARESGSADEAEAADYIVGELERLGIPCELHEPELYLSLPREGSVEVLRAPSVATDEEPRDDPSTAGGSSASAWRIEGKPPSFAASTPEHGLRAEFVHVPARPMEGMSDLFTDRQGEQRADVAGRIVVTEGYAMPVAVRRFEEAGAVGQIYINPGENVHWGICTPIWGTPSEDDLARKPRTPVVAISRPDGEALLERVEAAAAAGRPLEATLRTRLEEGWHACKLPVARIPGESDEFVLAHGHYDSWDVGVGDNAVGDATLLELARTFWAHRHALRRSLWVAWWPGHSTGRYAGSTWFADRFALPLRKRCVAAVNIDSPGCWKATEYEDVMWMAEAEALCRDAIRDATGKEATGRRPLRAGDYSFDQVGVTSFFMLLSSIPAEDRDRLGYYPVGGCGGNIVWHTEADTLDVADRDNLERDLRVYVTAIARVLNAPILPFDYRATLRELGEALVEYQAKAGGALDLSPALSELERLRVELEWLYGELGEPGRGGDEEVSLDAERVNGALREVARRLVPLGYVEGEPFAHDPALPRPKLPKLAGVAALAAHRASDSDRLPFLRAGLQRRANQVANALYEAAEAVRGLRQEA